MNTTTEEVLLRTSLQDCREKYDKLSKEYLELAAALMAKDEALQEIENLYPAEMSSSQIAKVAIAIKPHAALVAKIKADTVREHDAEVERRVLANVKVKIPTATMEYAFGREYDRGFAAGKAAAERIRKGE